jgi:hypothetical protein
MKMKIRLNEKQLKEIISDSVKKVLNEQGTPDTLIDELQYILQDVNNISNALVENVNDFEDSDLYYDLKFVSKRIEDLIEWVNGKNGDSMNFNLGDEYGNFGYCRGGVE